MPFWTVEDAGPYKEKSNFLMRTSRRPRLFYVAMRIHFSSLLGMVPSFFSYIDRRTMGYGRGT